jgi:hypothetical protein
VRYSEEERTCKLVHKGQYSRRLGGKNSRYNRCVYSVVTLEPLEPLPWFKYTDNNQGCENAYGWDQPLIVQDNLHQTIQHVLSYHSGIGADLTWVMCDVEKDFGRTYMGNSTYQVRQYILDQADRCQWILCTMRFLDFRYTNQANIELFP